MKISLVGFYHSKSVYVNGEKLIPETDNYHYPLYPAGFAWGYIGHAPLFLSLMILLKLTTREIAFDKFESFCIEVISQIEPDDFLLTEVDVSKYL